MDRDERLVLNSRKAKSNVNKNFYLKQDFLHTQNVLPLEPSTVVLNISELFSKERNESNCYRFFGDINIVASNVLMEWSGEDSYESVLASMDFDTDTNEYVFSQDDVLKEQDGWFYLKDSTTNCEKNYLEPKPPRFSPLNSSGDTNWNIWLTYPKEVDLIDLEFNSVKIKDGIAIYSGTTIIIDDRVMTVIVCAINHKLNIGDEIRVVSTTNTGFEGTYNVYALGFGDGTYTQNSFVIDVNLGTPPSFLGTETRFKRYVEGIPSEYHSRWLKKITNLSELEIYKTGFASNIYSDQIYSFNYNDTYNLSGLTDYLGRPVTDIYVSVIKKQDYKNSIPFWTIIESGLKTVILNSEYDINTITSINAVDSIESGVNSSSEYFFGDIIEFNPISQSEKILEIAYHRFNSLNRELNNFLEGYYYQPHYKQSIKKLSNYVQQKFSGETEIPIYATVISDGRAIWRDVLPPDFSNSTTIPFLNGCHYIYSKINLLVQRQDPCGVYNTANLNFVTGICENTAQFDETTPENICE